MKRVKTFDTFINEASGYQPMDADKKKKFDKFLLDLGAGDFYVAFSQGHKLKALDQNTAIDYAEAWAKYVSKKYVPPIVREYFFNKWNNQ